jgi:hypothetical protein
MPTPLYTLRLAAEAQSGLREVAKLCGYPSGRTYAAHVLRAVASGDLDRVAALRAELAMPTGEQMPLPLSEPRKRPTRAARRDQRKKNHGPPRRKRK